MLNINGYNFTDDGIKGKNLEKAFWDYIKATYPNVKIHWNVSEHSKIATSGSSDFLIKTKNHTLNIDVKNSSSVLSYDGTKKALIKGSSLVFYVPYIPNSACEMNENGSDFKINLEKCEYFLVNKKDFIKAVNDVGLIKEHHISTKGYEEIHMKTFYNNSKDALVSKKKCDALIEILYEIDRLTEILEEE